MVFMVIILINLNRDFNEGPDFRAFTESNRSHALPIVGPLLMATHGALFAQELFWVLFKHELVLRCMKIVSLALIFEGRGAILIRHHAANRTFRHRSHLLYAKLPVGIRSPNPQQSTITLV